jgi:hypothetical protein
MAHVLGTTVSLARRGGGFSPESEKASAVFTVAAAAAPAPPAAIFKNVRRLKLAGIGYNLSRAARSFEKEAGRR